MADDAILRETKASIDRLFSQVSGSAGRASTGLYDVAKAADRTEGGLGSLTDQAYAAARAAGGFVRAVDVIKDAAAGYDTTLSASAEKLKSELGTTLSDLTKGMEHVPAIVGGGAVAFGASLLKVATGLGTSIAGLITGRASLPKLGTMIKATGAAFLRVKTALLLLGAGTTLMEDYIDDSYQSFIYLSKSGITLGGDLRQVGGMAGRTRLSMQELSKALAAGSVPLAKFGGMADAGVTQLVLMQEALLSTTNTYDTSTQSFNKSLKMMGIASTESMGLLTELIGDQVFASKIRGMQEGVDAQRRTEITADYIRNLDELSKLTGKSREQLAKEMKVKAQDAQFAATLMDMDADQAAAAKAQLAFVENTYGKDAAELFKARMAGVVPTGEGARKLWSTSLGGVLEDMASETASTGGAAAAGILKSHMGELGIAARETRDMLKPLALAGGLVGQSFGNLFTATNTATLQNEAILEAMKLEHTDMDRLSEAMEQLYRQTRGMNKEGDEYKPEAQLLELKVQFTTMRELFTSLMHELITGITDLGNKSDVLVSGALMTGAETIMEHLLTLIQAGTNTQLEGPGTAGGTGGFHDYPGGATTFGDWLGDIGAKIGNFFMNTAGADSDVNTMYANELFNQTDAHGNRVASNLLLGKVNEQTLREQIASSMSGSKLSANMDVSAIINRVKMQEAMRATNLSEEKLASMQHGSGGRDTYRTLKEVTEEVLAQKLKTTADGPMKELAGFIHVPIVNKLKDIETILKAGNWAADPKEKTEKDDRNTGDNTNAEAERWFPPRITYHSGRRQRMNAF